MKDDLKSVLENIKGYVLLPMAGQNREHIIEKIDNVIKGISRLEQALYLDPLTGLYTRRGLEAQIDKISNEDIFEYGLFLADICGLKAINDSFGLEAGDYVIRSIAFGLRSNLKSGDFICRYGYSKSDEFVIVTDQTENKQEIANRIRVIPITLKQEPLLVSLHIGYTDYFPKLEEFSVAFARVMEQLNKKKKKNLALTGSA